MEHNKDDDSLISAVYTDSGDMPELNLAAFHGVEEDEEVFRREIETERNRVMREFGIFVPTSMAATDDDEISITDGNFDDNSIFADSYNGIVQQLDSNQKTSSTPETYDNVYGDNDDDEDESSSLQPNALFSSPIEGDEKRPTGSYREMLTPGRLGIAILILSLILVTSVAVAVGSFLAQDDGSSPAQSGAELQDLGSLVPSRPTTAPTDSFDWTEGDCMDHPHKKFNVNERFGEKSCIFLQTHPAQRDRMCLPENEGFRWCPVTCGVCEEISTLSDFPSDVPSDTPSAVPSTVEAAPRPVAIPAPRPVPNPTRRPVPDPTRRPVPDPTRRPVPDPTRRPVANPAPRPVANPAPRPVANPAPRPVANPAPRPVANPAPRPVANPAPRPVADPTRRPVADPTRRPVADPTRRPVADPTPVPVSDPPPEAPVAPPPTDSTPKPTDEDSPPQFLCRVCRLNICQLLPC